LLGKLPDRVSCSVKIESQQITMLHTGARISALSTCRSEDEVTLCTKDWVTNAFRASSHQYPIQYRRADSGLGLRLERDLRDVVTPIGVPFVRHRAD
jgi:hypothetical protein